MSGPFKMKGSPMARNYGAPFRDEKDKDQKKKVKVLPELDKDLRKTQVVRSPAMENLLKSKPAAGSPEMKNWQVAFDKAKKRDQGI